VNALLNVRSAQPHVLADRTAASFLKCLQDSPPGWVGDSMENAIHFVLCHGSKQ
jgi:hypothetical protein